jgi:hypothetical protein
MLNSSVKNQFSYKQHMLDHFIILKQLTKTFRGDDNVGNV